MNEKFTSGLSVFFGVRRSSRTGLLCAAAVGASASPSSRAVSSEAKAEKEFVKMCKKVDVLRALVTERLTAAAEEIFALVERTIAEYEEELCRSKEENQRKQQLLDSVLVPQVHTTADIEIQTETSKEPSVVKQEEKNPEFTCVIVKSEVGDFNGDEEEVEPPPLPETEERSGVDERTTTTGRDPAVRTANAASVEASDANVPEKTNKGLVNKRKHRLNVHGAATSDAAREFTPRRRSDESGTTERGAEKSNENERGGNSETQETRETHKQDSTATAQSKCPKPKRTWSRKSLQAVAKSVHEKGVKAEFVCSVCERPFSRLHHLERHILTHTGERSFSCSVCDKSFRLKQHLMSHMSIHTDEKLFSCSLCPLKFKRKDNLGRHIKNHSGDRPFGCSECDVRFTLKKNLVRHMIVHNRDVTFCCSVCHMTFSSPFYFQRHKKSHKRKRKVTH